MDATTVATAGVQPGDTTLIRIEVERLDALRRLRIVDAVIGNLEVGILTLNHFEALRRHRAARARLLAELGL